MEWIKLILTFSHRYLAWEESATGLLSENASLQSRLVDPASALPAPIYHQRLHVVKDEEDEKMNKAGEEEEEDMCPEREVVITVNTFREVRGSTKVHKVTGRPLPQKKKKKKKKAVSQKKQKAASQPTSALGGGETGSPVKMEVASSPTDGHEASAPSEPVDPGVEIKIEAEDPPPENLSCLKEEDEEMSDDDESEEDEEEIARVEQELALISTREAQLKGQLPPGTLLENEVRVWDPYDEGLILSLVTYIFILCPSQVDINNLLKGKEDFVVAQGPLRTFMGPRVPLSPQLLAAAETAFVSVSLMELDSGEQGSALWRLWSAGIPNPITNLELKASHPLINASLRVINTFLTECLGL